MEQKIKTKRPKLKLVGTDGNAFAVLGAAKRAAMAAKWSQEEWEKVQDQAISGDYDDMLVTLMEHFDVH